MKQNKQYEVLAWASLFLKNHGRDSHVAEMLLQHHLNVPRAAFFTMMRDTIPETVLNAFMGDIKNHAKTGVPVQHIIGSDMFYGRNFLVNEHVLIPRPETEELVQSVLSSAGKMNEKDDLTIVDIGTGSGVVATTLALELPYATVYATDISKEALTTATRNADRLDADVHFMEGDFLEPLIKNNIQPHIIVSNPPYIDWNEKEQLADTVKNFDPELALFANERGLASYKEIISQSHNVSTNLKLIAFEIGHDQGESVSTLLENAYPNIKTSTIIDINNRERIVLGHLT
ncbi:peptide chain release factor N(5)-glutamine methyltransferase [Virgibacillus sp. W0181]|uniref:peptide chain release factor N(5)-glutamine methyltransferase n=1 Tax=Virgibacillus sp. W0181 TaxID=3391581 RepID=UPI003F44D4DE